MGSMYEIRCDCGYKLSIIHSLGMRYPINCQRVMEEILKGGYGPEMEKAAKIVPHAAVCVEAELLRCPGCGALSNDIPVRLCAPIGKYQPRTEIFSSACRALDGPEYVMKREIGKRYYAVLEKYPQCSRCGMEMELADIDSEHRCPNCSRPVKARNSGLWD